MLTSCVLAWKSSILDWNLVLADKNHPKIQDGIFSFESLKVDFYAPFERENVTIKQVIYLKRNGSYVIKAYKCTRFDSEWTGPDVSLTYEGGTVKKENLLTVALFLDQWSWNGSQMKDQSFF